MRGRYARRVVTTNLRRLVAAQLVRAREDNLKRGPAWRAYGITAEGVSAIEPRVTAALIAQGLTESDARNRIQHCLNKASLREWTFRDLDDHVVVESGWFGDRSMAESRAWEHAADLEHVVHFEAAGPPVEGITEDLQFPLIVTEEDLAELDARAGRTPA